LAKSTGRSRSFLAAEAINEYLEVNEWQVTGIKRAIASHDRGEGIPHCFVKDWVASWGSANEKPVRAKGCGTRPAFTVPHVVGA
jgi:predicted transcriptional regulator